MKKFAIQAVLLILVITVALIFFSPTSRPPTIDLPFLPQTAVFKELQINEAKIKVEVADTQAKRSKGLGGRTSLGEDEGMLFVFPKADKYPFWMKGLKFPLDFVWIKDDKVAGLLLGVPLPSEGQTDESLPIYLPQVEVDKVLEVNAGAVLRLNIKVGDTIKII